MQTDCAIIHIRGGPTGCDAVAPTPPLVAFISSPSANPRYETTAPPAFA